jgi:hypothetical protein
MLMTASAPAVDADGCKAAMEDFTNARNDVSYTLKRYASCLSYSDGTDDCSSEFRKLKNAQSDVESAVSTGSYECI